MLNLTRCERTFELFACQNTLCGLQLVHLSATEAPDRLLLSAEFCFTTYGLAVKYFLCEISNVPFQHYSTVTTTAAAASATHLSEMCIIHQLLLKQCHDHLWEKRSNCSWCNDNAFENVDPSIPAFF